MIRPLPVPGHSLGEGGSRFALLGTWAKPLRPVLRPQFTRRGGPRRPTIL